MNWRLAVIVTSVLAAGGLIFLLAPILMPFVASFIIAYIGNPIVIRIQQWGLPRTLAVLLVFGLFFLALVAAMFGLVPAVHKQITGFVANIPVYLDWAMNIAAPWLIQFFGLDSTTLDLAGLKKSLIAHWRDVGGWLGGTMFRMSETGLNILGWLVNIALIPIISFYLLRDQESLLVRLDALMSPGIRPTVRKLASESDQVLSGFLRGQLTIMVVLAIVYCVGLSMMGLDLALPIGLLAGAVSFVPYLGFVTGIVAAGIAALIQFQDITMLVWVLGIFLAGQLLEGFVLTPWLIGDRLGLHPVAVIFSVMAGGQLFGLVGVMLALPAAAVLVVIFRHLQTRYSGPSKSVKKSGQRRRSSHRSGSKTKAARQRAT
ncbi:MAG: AI-2E family transporter [Gammaproteobacteria bacterium]|nr:MAG: AI-2E family transporter [Gammaproteobacteria bacterium]